MPHHQARKRTHSNINTRGTKKLFVISNASILNFMAFYRIDEEKIGNGQEKAKERKKKLVIMIGIVTFV